MMNEDVLKQIAAQQEAPLRTIGKDMTNLARMLKKTPFKDEEGSTERFQTNLVQASFYLKAYNVAVASFNKMISDKQDDPDCDKKLLDYFADQIALMIETSNPEVTVVIEEDQDDNKDQNRRF